MTGLDRISDERARQIEVEGYDAQHDKGHRVQLVRAAACYANEAMYELAARAGIGEVNPDIARLYPKGKPPGQWPWRPEYWKPTYDNPERMLEKAGALIAAALDAEDRR